MCQLLISHSHLLKAQSAARLRIFTSSAGLALAATGLGQASQLQEGRHLLGARTFQAELHARCVLDRLDTVGRKDDLVRRGEGIGRQKDTLFNSL